MKICAQMKRPKLSANVPHLCEQVYDKRKQNFRKMSTNVIAPLTKTIHRLHIVDKVTYSKNKVKKKNQFKKKLPTETIHHDKSV